MNRQRLILFVLAVIFVVAIIWSYSAMPRLKTTSSPQYTAAKHSKPATLPVKSASVSAADSRVLKIALLEQGQPPFKGYHRNIFKPVFMDELTLTKMKAAAVKPPPVFPVPPVKVAPVEPVQPVAAQPESAPLARFTFLGFLKKDGQRTIFLAKDKEIILVKKGDKIAGRYEASSITEQALTLLATDTGDEIIIPLIESRPLSAIK